MEWSYYKERNNFQALKLLEDINSPTLQLKYMYVQSASSHAKLSDCETITPIMKKTNQQNLLILPLAKYFDISYQILLVDLTKHTFL